MNKGKNSEHLLNEVRAIFEQHLQDMSLRRTSERFAILQEVYLMDHHFDADQLFIHMKERNYRVSRATVYNTLELLVNCGLVTKHQFGKNLAQFEKSYGFQQHDHLICSTCGKVMEFCDPRLHLIKKSVGEMLEFKITRHSLNFYGLCNDCSQE